MIRITGSEAVYGFASWLTTRPGTLKVGAAHNAAEMATLVSQWIAVNRLPEPRERYYPNNITPPPEEHAGKEKKP